MEPVVRQYAGMPISSSKPEAVFSYTGEVVTKKRNGLHVSSVEAMAVVNDFTRQPDYSFDAVLKEITILSEELEVERAARRKEKRRINAEHIELKLKQDALNAAVDNLLGDSSSSSNDDAGD